MTAKKALARIEQAANATQEVRDTSSLQVGECVRQGDLYLWRISDDWTSAPQPPQMKIRKDRQLATGTSRGARHIVEGDARVYDSRLATPPGVTDRAIYGPAILVGIRGAIVTHPEHAHVKLPPNTAWQVTHQLDWSSQRAVWD
jgi:hypothetical protein